MIIEATFLFWVFSLSVCKFFHILTHSNYVIYHIDSWMRHVACYLRFPLKTMQSCLLSFRSALVVGVELVSHQTGLQLVSSPILMPLNIFIYQIHCSCRTSSNILNLFCSFLVCMFVFDVQRHKQSVCVELPGLNTPHVWPVCVEDYRWWTK